jgi:release factor glutamine methyltransferase
MSELLMAHVLGLDGKDGSGGRLRLYMDQDRPASSAERARLRDLVGRALKHEPVQYLVGEAWFYGLPFYVSPAVLIPRPCTEVIVEEVLSHARAAWGAAGKTGEGLRIADVCTGSGCVVIALLKNLPHATGIGADISADALAVAKRNAERHGVDGRVELVQGDLLEPLIDHPAGGGVGGNFHYLVSNPPYIPDSEWDAVPVPGQEPLVDKSVRDFEPHLALRGGVDGLRFVRPLIEKGPERLRERGVMMVEIAAASARAALKMMREQPLIDPDSVRVVKDHEGLERVVVGTRRA